MLRTKLTDKVDAIFVADIHLREDTPVSRTDNFLEAQWKKLDFIGELQAKHNCPVFHSGDLFHHWKPSPFLLSQTMKHLPDNFHTVFGNHDLPQHNLQLRDKSGVQTLAEAGKLFILNQCHWNQEPDLDNLIDIEGKKGLVWHIMTYQAVEPFPGCIAPKAAKLLRKYPGIDFIVTGDNHTPFVEEHEGRILVNPGSMMRQSAAQIDFQPRVYIYTASTNSVKKQYLPIITDVISRQHLEETEKRNTRLEAFISTLNDNWDVSLTFEENMEQFLQTNPIRTSVQQIIRNFMST